MSTSLKQQIFRKGSTTYFNASRFFPAPVREDVFTLYAYVRVADDFVDVVPANTEAFHRLVRQTWEAWDGVDVEDEIVKDFVALARKCGFEKEWVEGFLWSMEQDLSNSDYATYEDLEKYIYGSAEVIGLMMARVLQLPREADEAARLQGKAMQFLNFIRDVAEDKRLGRIYMPGDDRATFGIGVGDWDQERWSALLRFELDRYFVMQKEAELGYSFIPPVYRIPIQTAAAMYLWTGKKIYDDPTVVWRRKVKPSPYRVVAAYFKNYFASLPHAR